MCTGTGAGLRVLRPLCRGPVLGTDFSMGMLTQARRAHPGAGWVRADARALPFAGAFDLAVSFGAAGPAGAPLPVTSRGFWALAGFDLVMRARNAVWRPPFVMYYRTWPLPAVRRDLAGAGFTVTTIR